MPPKKGKITFTVKWLNALKPAEKELTWTESHGFTIRVLPSGVKTWWYYYILNGKRRKMNLGIYPYVSLEEARKLHREALGQVERGMDPMAPPPEPTPEPEVLTVNALAEKWIEHSQRIHTKKWSNTLILALKKDFLPSHGHRLVTELKRRDAIEILRIKSLTAPGQAVNLHKSLRGMWELGVNEEYVDFNPFAEMRVTKAIPALRQKSRKRFLTEDEIKFVWSAIESYGGSDSLKRALKIMLLTGQRNGEVCGMRRSEIHFGIGRPQCWQCRRCGWWTIPETRRMGNKGGEHRVYLTPFALKIIGEGQEIVFPGDTNDKSISANSVNYHVRRNVEGTGKTPYYGLPRWTPHDLRRTCSTNIRRLGGPTVDMDLVLGHAAGGVTGIYDQYEGEPEKMQWLMAWSDYIQQLVGF